MQWNLQINMKGTIKANTVDRYLRPIRDQIMGLIVPNTTVIEFGCGNGDLLFKLSKKIESGIGVDKSEKLIAYAKVHKKRENIENLLFKTIDLTREPFLNTPKSYGVASLLFHVLTWHEAIELLNQLIKISETTIICGFSKPKNVKQQALLWLDQRFTGHYTNYQAYKKNGYIQGLLNTIEGIEFTEIETFDPVITIYQVTKK